MSKTLNEEEVTFLREVFALIDVSKVEQVDALVMKYKDSKEVSTDLWFELQKLSVDLTDDNYTGEL